ncbi:hypothetical protein ETH99_09065 [Macrococcoides caseolyticum]|uniref:hypothetical protein n=1 Tax=Macrococcoides caseolyticum TaxID=69966 RepID=UPI00105B6F6B|nr:hypothetical protein [Macrococcus caseolyticus]TDM25824.1 hypothetical protein ETH99_09065 [Macrococcus caseolyticus]
MANKREVRHLGSGNKIFIAVCGEQRRSSPPRVVGTRYLSLYVANKDEVHHLGSENNVFIAVCGE